MRDIKFRAWDNEAKEMLYLTGFRYFDRNGIQLFYNYEDEGTAIRSLNVEDIELMQYTGLNDKNGVEIYEGDIVNCIECECCGYIGWNDSEAGFYFNILLEDGRYEEEQLYDYVDEVEVIGNIYENPELLNEEEQA